MTALIKILKNFIKKLKNTKNNGGYVGRIRTRFVKTMAEELFVRSPDKFGPNFDVNKKGVDEAGVAETKFIRNKIAGYIVKVSQRKRI